MGCRRIGSYLCKDCVGKIEYLKIQVCSVCYRSAIGGKTHPGCQKKTSLDGVISLSNYKRPIKDLIKSLKYNFTTDLLKEFSEKFSFEPDILPNKTWVLVPLPLYRARENFRGFNQAELLGKIVAQKLNLSFDRNVLKRKLDTKSQVGLSQKQRRENIALAFEALKEVNDESFYIFDDVWTSGATLKSAAKELKKAGAKSVWGLTLAHPR